MGFQDPLRQGLIYQGFRVLPYSWAEQTPLSNHETRLDDSYKMRQDPTLTVTMPLTGAREGTAAQQTVATHPELLDAAAIAWTTTPCTSSNLALAVNPTVTYQLVRVGEDGAESFAGDLLLLAEPLVGAYAKEFGENREVVASFTGEQLVGLTYEPVFDYFRDTRNAFQILSADYVTTEDGTGVVHQAPAFGEDDMNTCEQADIDLVIPVDIDGTFTSQVPEYAGQLVFDANKDIIKDLKAAVGYSGTKPSSTPTRTRGVLGNR